MVSTIGTDVSVKIFIVPVNEASRVWVAGKRVTLISVLSTHAILR